MAYAPSNTFRGWVDYEVGGNQHSLMLRASTLPKLSDAFEVMNDLFAALTGELYLVDILGARYAAKDSDVTLPTTWPGLSQYGSGSGAGTTSALQVTFVGRALTGPRWSVQVYGLKFPPPVGWRLNVASVPAIQAAHTVLSTAFYTGDICAITGGGVALYDYVNFGYNDHWVKEARRG